jgi:hypothetical protein
MMGTDRKYDTLSNTFKKRWSNKGNNINLKKIEKYLEGCDDLDIPEAYHSKLIYLLFSYYQNNHNYIPKRDDKKIKADIKVIEDFIKVIEDFNKLLDKNLVTTFRPLTAQPTIEFCNQLKNELENGLKNKNATFELNQRCTKFHTTKNQIKDFFEKMPTELKPTALVIKQFIDGIKPL